LRQLPIGQPGDLFIGGEGVGRGYLNRDDLTAHCFLPDPFRGGAARMYRTGDIARWLPDGTLELIGRTDDQLKVRGHRVEAGEVEAALLRLPGVSQAVVAMHRPDHGDPRLVAYLVAEPGAQIPPSAELRAPLREWLAEYMLPYHFVPLSALPLTPNGKVDRRALTGLYRAAAEAAPTAQPPCELEPSALEAELLAHFSRVLGCQVTLDSDFFEAGGDSLGVLRLIARVLQERGLELRSGELFMHSTPRRMAAWLGQLISGAARPDHLVALREGSSSGAVILVHPMSGHLASYGRLVHLLGSSVTLFGLQAGTGGPAYTSIGARCMAYVEEVMMAAAEGPLILGGYSLGGALAMEMAEQLRRAGRAVSAVLLMDAQVPRPPKRGWAKLRHRAAELRRFSWHDRHLWLRDQILRRVHNGRGDAQEFGEADGLISQAEIDLLISQALRWEPPRYTGKVHLFRAERNIRGYANPRGSVGWDPYCSNLEVLMLPCNHREIMGEPHVMRIVSVIDSLLARATPAISNKSNQRFKTAAASSAAILGVRQPLRTPQV
jgi:thioesterase domain-containing protein/acyl carrier protein